jgi:hypothetical protein
MNSSVETVLAAAIRAPSGDNTQPWRFVVDNATQDESVVHIGIDSAADPSPMNAGQRMARVACGAAIENMARTAEHNGFLFYVEPTNSLAADGPDVVAYARLLHCGRTNIGQIDDAIFRRVTNRRLYDGQRVTADVVKLLTTATAQADDVTTHWLTDRGRIATLASLVGRADGVMFGIREMRRAFLAQVRFDAQADAQVEHGLSLASLELSGLDRLGLGLLGWLPQWGLQASGALRALDRRAVQSVQSAAGLCLIVAPDSDPWTDVAVGRAMQRAWLAATEESLAFQPMMSLPVLENFLENRQDWPAVWANAGPLATLRDEVQQLVAETGSGRLAALARFGYAAAPSGRTGRWPLQRAIRCMSDRPAMACNQPGD